MSSSHRRGAALSIVLAICCLAPVIAAVKVGQKAPALEVTDLKSKKFSLAAENKAGPVFVNFWATWCGPCREEMPLISDLNSKYSKQGLRVISVAIKDKPDAVKKFVASGKFSHRIAIDSGNKAFKAWDLDAVPSSYLIGKGGKIVGFYDQFDKSDLPAIEKEIKKALDAY